MLNYVRHVAGQPCLICGRLPSDAHHLRFAQSRALGLKVSDDFTVPLCRGHHREIHRHGNEAAWWKRAGIDAVVAARSLWVETHHIATSGDHSSLVAAIPIDQAKVLGCATRERDEIVVSQSSSSKLQ